MSDLSVLLDQLEEKTGFSIVDLIRNVLTELEPLLMQIIEKEIKKLLGM